MTPSAFPQSGPGGSAKRLIATQYFIYFGVLGAYLPFFNLYCYHIGLSGFQIGAISAVRSATLVLFALVWGVLADKFSARRSIYIACNFIGTGFWSLYLFTEQFYPMLAITLCYGVFFSPLVSFLEAFTMDVLGGEKKHYGRIRAWGSISFIAVVICLGRAIDTYSIRIVLAVVLIGSVLQALFASALPSPVAERKVESRAETRFLFRRPALVFFASAFLMLVSHGAYYGFFSIHLETLGFGRTFIGFCWALASAAEIAVMLGSGRLFAKFSPQKVLSFSFLCAVLRWLWLFFAQSPGGILLSQILHAITYGAFHMASILYIDALAPASSKTIGQAVNNAVSYGLGLMVGFFLAGDLYERLGSQALFPVSAGIALAGGLMFKILDSTGRR